MSHIVPITGQMRKLWEITLKIIVSYFQQKREKLKLPADARGLVLFDNFYGQCTSPLLKLLDDNIIILLSFQPTALIGCSC